MENIYEAWSRRIIIGGAYAILLTPLVFQQNLMHPLITIKAVFFQTIVQIIGIAYIGLSLADPSVRPRRTIISMAVLIFIAALGISSLFGVNIHRSFWSIPERLTGIFFLIHCAALFFVLSGMRKYFSWIAFFSFLAGVSFFVALFPVAQLLFPGIFFDAVADNVKGTIGNPIFLSAYLLFNMVIAWWLAYGYYERGARWQSVAYTVIGIFNLLVIILTQTRGAFVALVSIAGLFSLYVVYRQTVSISWRRGIAVAWIIFFAAGAVVFATRQLSVWQTVPLVGRLAAHIGFAPRLIAWQSSLAAFLDRPLTGWGWENFYYAFNAHYNPQLLRYGIGESFFDKPHNIFIEFLTNTGIIGFGAYGFLIGAALWAARRQRWVILLLTAYLVHNFFAFDTIVSYIMLFIILAYLDSHVREETTSLRAWTLPRYGYAPVMCVGALAASMLIYFTNYRIWYANHAEYVSINYLVQNYIPEGLKYFNTALAAPTPYRRYIQKDIAPIIGQLYKKNIALPELKTLVQRSIQELEQAIAVDPRHYGFQIGFADFITSVYALDSSLAAKAEAAIREAEKASPGRQTTHYITSKLRYLKGDTAGAREALRAAVALDPEVGEARFYYGLLLLQTGLFTEGKQEIEQAEAFGRGPKNAAETHLLGGYFGDANDYTRAAYYFQKAILFKPDDLETKMKLGLVYYLGGTRDAARRLISEVMKTENLKLSPQYPSLQPILKDLGLE